MSRHFAGSLIAPALALALVAAPVAASAAAQNAAAPATHPSLTLTSTAFSDCGIIPNKYTQDVSSPVSPPLRWSYVPEGTVSFALVIDDPDTALNHSTAEVLHWLIFNIPGSSRSLPEGVPNQPNLPDGAIQGKNTGGIPGFRGPGAPAAGPYHHYTFQLYALDTKLSLGPDATRAELLKAMDGHVLGKGVLVGRFHR